MYYYVIYDLKDNIIAYISNIFDLCNFTGLRKGDLVYKFKKSKKDYIYYNSNNCFNKIYRFEE